MRATPNVDKDIVTVAPHYRDDTTWELFRCGKSRYLAVLPTRGEPRARRDAVARMLCNVHLGSLWTATMSQEVRQESVRRARVMAVDRYRADPGNLLDDLEASLGDQCP
ncbi:MAG TPA: hypothetical protein PLV68_03265 [Ilumatobacteraceae bacterium]|nr:hypothetical protein [Ilumatobacteraceae bacterium]